MFFIKPSLLISQNKENVKKDTVTFFRYFSHLDSLRNYFENHSILSVSTGIGYIHYDEIMLNNIHRDLRYVPPHNDDVLYRPYEIADPRDENNYIVSENKVILTLPYRKYIDLLCFSVYGIFNVSLKTTAINDVKENESKNYFLKQYIPPFPGEKEEGSALIYYSIKTKKRELFNRNSFTIPIYISFPLIGVNLNQKTKPFNIRFIGGTNVLLPENIKIEAERGWHRWGSQEEYKTSNLGEIKEIKYFAGFDVEGSISNSVNYFIQCCLVKNDYGDKNIQPLILENKTKYSLSFNIQISKLKLIK